MDHLIVRNLDIGYQSSKNKKVICSAINFELKEGEIVCLLGRNGAGKSTLLKTIANMIPLLNGSISIHNSAYNELDTKEFAQKISIVLTESLPENSLTVYETIALGRQPYTNWLGKTSKKDNDIVRNAMLVTDTLELKQRYINQLSDGQLQRVMIARALAQDTPIILLDEPTSHLDIHHKLNVFKILKKIRTETKKTILISTHEINLALKNSDRLLLIHENNVSIGTLKEHDIQQELEIIFNSDAITYDVNTNQFLF